MLVSEKNIEDAIAFYEANEDLLKDLVQQNIQDLPRLNSFIYSDNFSILSEEEKSVLEYVFLIIIQAIGNAHIEIKDPSGEKIEKKEELNWAQMQESKGKTFRNKLDGFFESSKEEELLALMEDSLESEGDEISPVGKEVIFVGLKTVMDSLLF